ncbi:MAG TPA: hypothetical protein VMU34_16880 [Mycobacterium sp.]|nr:hypothetical protein [Mycobacterium sp.]
MSPSRVDVMGWPVDKAVSRGDEHPESIDFVVEFARNSTDYTIRAT